MNVSVRVAPVRDNLLNALVAPLTLLRISSDTFPNLHISFASSSLLSSDHPKVWSESLVTVASFRISEAKKGLPPQVLCSWEMKADEWDFTRSGLSESETHVEARRSARSASAKAPSLTCDERKSKRGDEQSEEFV